MGFLNFFTNKDKNSPRINIYAPISGEIVNLEEVPDVIFSEKIVGDGVAINPTSEWLVAPADGVITKIFDTNHAFAMTTTEGIDLFVHFGVDTVELKGDGFECFVKVGQKVKLGETILKANLAKIEQRAKSIITPIIITNTENIEHLLNQGNLVTAGESVILSLRK